MANPCGFSQQQKTLLPPIVQALEYLGPEVWEPFTRNNQIAHSQSGWAYRVAEADMNDVKNYDGIFVIVNGKPPDEGVMIELGIAIAYNRGVFLFRDDFRRCTDSDGNHLNLMLFCELPELGLEN